MKESAAEPPAAVDGDPALVPVRATKKKKGAHRGHRVGRNSRDGVWLQLMSFPQNQLRKLKYWLLAHKRALIEGEMDGREDCAAVPGYQPGGRCHV